MDDKEIKNILQNIKQSIIDEQVSYMELATLDGLREHININDKTLMQWTSYTEEELNQLEDIIDLSREYFSMRDIDLDIESLTIEECKQFLKEEVEDSIITNGVDNLFNIEKTICKQLNINLNNYKNE